MIFSEKISQKKNPIEKKNEFDYVFFFDRNDKRKVIEIKGYKLILMVRRMKTDAIMPNIWSPAKNGRGKLKTL